MRKGIGMMARVALMLGSASGKGICMDADREDHRGRLIAREGGV